VFGAVHKSRQHKIAKNKKDPFCPCGNNMIIEKSSVFGKKKK